jgi:hypothetical protein
MKVFLSWSGTRSLYIAETLKVWLEEVLQATEPWISKDIDKGKRWSAEIAKSLKESKIGIICLTEDNLKSEWINFEAGAISNTEGAYVCTFLYGLSATEVKPPLSEFQATKFEKDDVLKLLMTINGIIGEVSGKSISETNLCSVFEKNWSYLVEGLSKTPPLTAPKNLKRTSEDILEEVLQNTRSILNWQDMFRERRIEKSHPRELISPKTYELIKVLALDYISSHQISSPELISRMADVIRFVKYKLKFQGEEVSSDILEAILVQMLKQARTEKTGITFPATIEDVIRDR